MKPASVTSSAARGQLQRQADELVSNLAQEPALQAAAAQTAAALAACASKLATQNQALVQLGGSDDGRGAVDDAGYRRLLEQRGQLQRQREELGTNLAQEPAFQAAAAQAGEALAACRTELDAKRHALATQLGDSADGRGEVDEAGFQALLGQRGQLQQRQEELTTNLAQEPELKAAAVQAGEALTACRADLDEQWQALTARLGRDYARDHQAAAQAIRAQVRQADREVATAAAADERLPRERAHAAQWQSRCQKLRKTVERRLAALDAAMPAETDAIDTLAQQELRKIAAEIARLDPEQAAAAQQDALQRRGAAVTRQQQALAEGHRLAASAVDRASGVGVTLPDVAEVWQRASQIREALPAVTAPLPPTEDIEAQVSKLRERLVRCDQDIERTWEDLALSADYVVPGVAEADESGTRGALGVTEPALRCPSARAGAAEDDRQRATQHRGQHVPATAGPDGRSLSARAAGPRLSVPGVGRTQARLCREEAPQRGYARPVFAGATPRIRRCGAPPRKSALAPASSFWTSRCPASTATAHRR